MTDMAGDDAQAWWGRDGDFFDYPALMALASRLTSGYRQAQPFPHCVIDGFLPMSVIEQILGEFPDPDPGKQRQNNTAYDDSSNPVQLRKVGIQDEQYFAPCIRRLFHELNSWSFLRFLERLTGIPALLPDPSLRGGGAHQTLPGGLLQVHVDFNQHPVYQLDRRINVLLYLNRDWKEEYGGHIELWDREATHCVKRVLPVAGRCVIFSTTSDSWHGHPQPLSCPEGMMRRSLALYYYTNGRPADEVRPRHKVVWRGVSQEGGQHE